MTTKPTESNIPGAEELTDDQLQDVVGSKTVAHNFEERKVKPKGYIGETEKNLVTDKDHNANSLLEEEGIYRK